MPLDLPHTLYSDRLTRAIGGGVCVRWRGSATDRHASDLIEYIRSYAEEFHATIRAGETIGYGYWLVHLMPVKDGLFEFWEWDSSVTNVVQGCTLALDYRLSQEEICGAHNSPFDPPAGDHLISVDPAVLEGAPVEGSRYRMSDGHSGWILVDPDRDISRAVPEHGYHVTHARPDIARFLALQYGSWFTWDGERHEVGFDIEMLNTL